jgi:hypothetical protein
VASNWVPGIEPCHSERSEESPNRSEHYAERLV